jgi:hypothetical protein
VAQRGVRRQCLCQYVQQHNHNGQWWQRRDEWQDGSTIAECGAAITMLLAAAMANGGQTLMQGESLMVARLQGYAMDGRTVVMGNGSGVEQ